MRRHSHVRGVLFAQLLDFILPIFDFLRQRLVLDLELLEVDEVQALGQLLLRPEFRFALLQGVPQVDVLQAHLLQLLVA